MKNEELLKFVSSQGKACSFTLMNDTQGEGTLLTIKCDTSGKVMVQIACPTPSGKDTPMQFPAHFIKYLTITEN